MAFACAMIAASLMETICAAVRASQKWPSPASGPSSPGLLAAEMSSANSAVSPSRPRKMHGASSSASESAIPGRKRPSSAGDASFCDPRRKGCRRHIGNTSDDGSHNLDLIQTGSVRFSLARLSGLPAKGIILFLRLNGLINYARVYILLKVARFRDRLHAPRVPLALGEHSRRPW